MQVVNPATEESRTIDETPLAQVPEYVKRAREAQPAWADTPLAERIRVLSGLPKLILEQAEEIAKVVAADMGKPLNKALGEVQYSAEEIQYFCDRAEAWLAQDEVEEGYVRYDPLGLVAVISPWNYPFLVPFTSIVPALLAGNAVVFKPSEYTLFTGLEITRLLHELPGFPAELLQVIIGGKEHGKTLVEQDLALVSFTGSTVAGKDIMRRSADKLHKVLLELGGMDAAIVLKDVDVAQTAAQIVKRNCINTGQVCCSIKRVYVEREIYDDFVEAAATASQGVSFGAPDENEHMGPLVAKFQRDKIEEIVGDARDSGARVLTGGERPKRDGYFYPSTVIADVSHEMRVMTEEPFGPVLPVFPVDSWEQGVELANDSPYGLTGSVWTNDEELGQRVASKLDVGVAGINVHGSGPVGTPWGGTKQSGIGRMKTREGLREFTNVKLVRLG